MSVGDACARARLSGGGRAGGKRAAGSEPEQDREEGAGPCEHWPRRARAEVWAACGIRLEKRGRGGGGLGCWAAGKEGKGEGLGCFGLMG